MIEQHATFASVRVWNVSCFKLSYMILVISRRPKLRTLLQAGFILFRSFRRIYLQAKDLLEDLHGVLGALDRVADGAGVLVDLKVVAALGRLVAEEVNVLVCDAVGLLGLALEVLEAVGLVPAGGEDVKGDLAADGEAKKGEVSRRTPENAGRGGYIRQTEVAKLLLEDGDKLLADLGVLVVGLKLVALLVAGVAADGADVDHAVAELDKGAALDGDVEVGNVVEDKVGELLVLGLADPLDEAVGGQGLAELEGRQAVLGEAKVEEGGDGGAGGPAELLLLLGEVGAADEADGALLAQGAEEGEDFGGGAL